MKLRGYASIALLCIGLLISDVVQRIVIAPWVSLRSDRRVDVLGRWQHTMAWYVLTCSRIGGARIPPPLAAIPAEPGHLILMNHQSLFDIPLVVQSVVRGYPRIVTRQRYSRSIPLISHMVRLYQYPTVDPSAGRAELRRMLDELEEIGRTSDVPIALFPEGTRTRDGSIGAFKSGGLARLLKARPWTVHVIVADGFWQTAKFGDLLDGMGGIDGRIAYAGTLEWTDTTADGRALVSEARAMMVTTLESLRAGDTVVA